MTLTGVADTTGISKSTLSRLENGQRRPTLELLFALSQAYRVPLDALVDAPNVGDPRVRLKPGRVKGRTVIPLTRQPDGMQAWKIVIPTSKVTPEPRAHDGHEWIYVLSGHMRLVLGDRGWVLGPGEVAEFDTQVPHWFGSTGATDAAALTVAFSDAQRRGGGIVVMHAGQAAPFGPAALAPWTTRFPDVPVELSVVPGSPVPALLAAAVEARLVVVGTRARRAPARALFGSTSRAVLRRSSVPVVVVNPGAAA